jgi:hypothetical protein
VLEASAPRAALLASFVDAANDGVSGAGAQQHRGKQASRLQLIVGESWRGMEEEEESDAGVYLAVVAVLKFAIMHHKGAYIFSVA